MSNGACSPSKSSQKFKEGKEESKGSGRKKIIPHLVLAAHRGKGEVRADGTESRVPPAPPLCCVSRCLLNKSLDVWGGGREGGEMAQRFRARLLF